MIPSRDTAHLVQDPGGNWIVVGTPKPAEGVPPPPLNAKLPDDRAARPADRPSSAGASVEAPRAPAAVPPGAHRAAPVARRRAAGPRGRSTGRAGHPPHPGRSGRRCWCAPCRRSPRRPLTTLPRRPPPAAVPNAPLTGPAPGPVPAPADAPAPPAPAEVPAPAAADGRAAPRAGRRARGAGVSRAAAAGAVSPKSARIRFRRRVIRRGLGEPGRPPVRRGHRDRSVSGTGPATCVILLVLIVAAGAAVQPAGAEGGGAACRGRRVSSRSPTSKKAVRGSIVDRNFDKLAFTIEARALTFQPVRIRKQLADARAKTPDGARSAAAAARHRPRGVDAAEQQARHRDRAEEAAEQRARSSTWPARSIPAVADRDHRRSSPRSAPNARTSGSIPVARWRPTSSAASTGTATA